MLFGSVVAVALVAYNTLTNLQPSRESSYLARNALAGGVLFLVARAAGLDDEALGIDTATLGEGLRWGRGGVVVVALGTALAGVAAGRSARLRRALSDRRADLPPDRLAFQVVVRIPLGTAAFEEFAFRGVLLAAFATGTGTPVAVVASSLAFGAWHIAPTLRALDDNGVTDASDRRRRVLAAVVMTSVGGVLFSGLRLGSGSLLAPAIAHAAINAFGLLLAAAVQRTERR